MNIPLETGYGHRVIVDYIRCSSTSIFSPQRPLIAVADMIEYEEWVVSQVVEFFGLIVPNCIIRRVGHYGYKTGLAITRGITLYVIPHSQEMGQCLQISGEGMQVLRLAGWTDLEIVRKLSSVGVKYSRLDVAIDTYNGYVVSDLLKTYKDGQWKPSKAKKLVSVLDMETGAGTLYVGSRKSDDVMRAYDKSTMAGEPERRTRLEMEYKKDRAKWAAYSLCLQGFGGVVYDILDKMNVRGVAFFPCDLEIDVKMPVERPKTLGDSSKAAWVRRCIAAIAEGALDMGLSEFKRILHDSLGFCPFDNIQS